MKNGMALAEEFYTVCGEPVLRDAVPEIMERAAVGLVGEGSECFGCDDAISRDHDWGPAFCLWLPQEELEMWGDRLEAALAGLPPTFKGSPTRMRPERRMGRVGPHPIEGFYARFTRLPHPPTHWREWRLIPEHFLAVCTNGKVFYDGAGRFTAFREALLAFYPEDVRLKKLAARCMTMAQAGQYNLPRSLRRNETTAAMLAAARFTEAALSAVFLLNRRYMPFYKWAHRLADELPLLGASTQRRLTELAALEWSRGKALEETAAETVEMLCAEVAAALRDNGLSDAPGNWLLDHGPSVQERIVAPELRSLPVMLE